MIIDSFNKEKGKMSPKDLYGEGKYVCDTCIIVFSYQLMERIKKEFDLTEVAIIKVVNEYVPVYSFIYKGKKLCVYNSCIGSTLAGTFMIEANHFTGATKFIMFGSCGIVDENIMCNTFIVPTSAYRDEGFSYHYAPPQDYIKIKNASFVESFIKKRNYPYTAGRIWTTDAFYKETQTDFNKRKKAGCIAVEMECAGCQAVSDYYGWDFYEFIFGGDM